MSVGLVLLLLSCLLHVCCSVLLMLEEAGLTDDPDSATVVSGLPILDEASFTNRNMVG